MRVTRYRPTTFALALKRLSQICSDLPLPSNKLEMCAAAHTLLRCAVGSAVASLVFPPLQYPAIETRSCRRRLRVTGPDLPHSRTTCHAANHRSIFNRQMLSPIFFLDLLVGFPSIRHLSIYFSSHFCLNDRDSINAALCCANHHKIDDK